MSEPAGSPRIDALWGALAPHVEWPEGFSLVVLFAGHPGPAGELSERLEASVRQRGKTLARIEPAREDDVRALLPRILAPPEPDCGAVWISLLQGGGDPAWTAALRWLLQRLNERRFVLERDVRVPVVVVLPLELRSEVYALAPDLWSVRGFAEVVPSPTVEEPGARRTPHSVVPHEAAEAPARGRGRPPGRVEAEWARLLATGDLPRLSIWDGVAAQESALERGDLRAARRIAMETLAVALIQAGVSVERLDGFDVTEALAEADPHSAHAQSDLSVSLIKLGDVEVQAGNLAAARFLYQRSLDLREALAEADPHSAHAQRDLSVPLERLGDVEVRAGNLAAARSLFQRSLSIDEALAEADPHSAHAQRDLSISLAKLGDVEVQAGNLAAARSLYQRSLDLCEALAEADPHSAQTQRDLSVSLDNLGGVEVQAGNLAAARSLYQRSLDLREAVAEADPHSARAQRDLSVSLNKLGDVEVQAGNLAAARSLFQRSLSIDEALAEGDPHSAHAQRDLSISLNKLGGVEVRVGNPAAARSLFQRALSIAEALAEADPHDARASFDVVKFHEFLAWAAGEEGDRDSETDHLRRAHAILAAMDANGQIRDYADRARLLEDISRRLP